VVIAIVGLVGVLLGTLFGAVTKTSEDRRLRRVGAIASGRVLAAEMKTAAFQQTDAPTDFSEGRWHQLLERAAFDMPQSLVDQVHNAFAVMNSPSPAVTQQNLQVLSSEDLAQLFEQVEPEEAALVSRQLRANVLDSAAMRLEEHMDTLALIRTTERVGSRAAIGVLAVLAVALLSIAAVRQAPQTSAAAITAAVQRDLGTDYVVDCDPHNGDWACEVASVHNGCPESTTTPQSSPTQAAEAPPPSAREVTPVVAALPSPQRTTVSCDAGTFPSTDLEATLAEDERLVVVGALPDAPGTLMTRRFEVSKQSGFRRFWNALGGSD
jgi:hypothetical protein